MADYTHDHYERVVKALASDAAFRSHVRHVETDADREGVELAELFRATPGVAFSPAAGAGPGSGSDPFVTFGGRMDTYAVAVVILVPADDPARAQVIWDALRAASFGAETTLRSHGIGNLNPLQPLARAETPGDDAAVAVYQAAIAYEVHWTPSCP